MGEWKIITWFIQSLGLLSQGLFIAFFKDNSAIFKALFPFESDVSVGDTKYRILKPVEDRKNSYNDPSIPGSSTSIFGNLKQFPWTTSGSMLPYFGVVRSLLELVKKFQGLLVELENLNFSFLRIFSGYDNFPRTIQGLCEPCINLKTIQWPTNLKKSGPKIRSKRKHHLQDGKAKKTNCSPRLHA